MSQDIRLDQIKDWLSTELATNILDIAPASADASFRRYFRVQTNHGTRIVMDAPPEKEDCQSFVHIARMIEAAGVQAPHIYEHDDNRGFMLLSDLGSQAYLDNLNPDTADKLYSEAMNALMDMQELENGLPPYDEQLLQFEMSLFRDWYLGEHLGLPLSGEQQQSLQAIFDLLCANALQQPQVFVHRDYHSRNLMLTATDNPGVIDFQDAVIGPISYDLVSLLKDCYIAWPRPHIEEWIHYFVLNHCMTKSVGIDQFTHWFDLMGVQRHLKAIGIFSRLNHRDGKPGYLDDIPRTLAYVFDACQRYPELQPLAALFNELGVQVDPQLLDQLQ